MTGSRRMIRAFVVEGMAALGLGLLAALSTDDTVITALVITAAYLLVDGIAALLAGLGADHGALREESWTVSTTFGIRIFGIGVGLNALLRPNTTVWTSLEWMGCWLIIRGAVDIIAAVSPYPTRGLWFLTHVPVRTRRVRRADRLDANIGARVRNRFVPPRSAASAPRAAAIKHVSDEATIE
ncbi:DUF308 domain-containing protein [Nocardia sp. NPDC058058]|uniref:DUF308 domain-containing protein n=1 Tax=Nocardia sp. NPDC058058 TaxID=3346317 RepID=UPI0036D75C2D